MSQQYSTPDGSVWECLGGQGDGDKFSRVSGLGADMDFRVQSLDEVLGHWGPLSLYDPFEEMVKITTAACLGLVWDRDSKIYGTRLAKEFDRMGYRLVKKDES